jgi:hypothetical protein
MRTRLLSAIGAVVLGWATLGAQSATVNVAALGPQVGSAVPEFAATDQFGKPHTLASTLGARGAMLVFFRSADW